MVKTPAAILQAESLQATSASLRSKLTFDVSAMREINHLR
jgi:hypothetical protein